VRLSRSHVDRIGERFRKGEIDPDVIVELSRYRNGFASAYRAVEILLRERLGLEVSGRPAKSTTAIVDKLQRESIRLSQMQDIAGCRVIVNGMHGQDNLVEDLEVLLEGVKVVDRRSNSSHGYRAVHLIVNASFYPVEIQIRTRMQHMWADISEKLADSYGQEVKYGRGNEAVVKLLRNLSTEIERLEKIRFDRNIIRRRGPLRYYSFAPGVTSRRIEKDLARLDRESLYQIRRILSTGVEV